MADARNGRVRTPFALKALEERLVWGHGQEVGDDNLPCEPREQLGGLCGPLPGRGVDPVELDAES